jgi:hypothetical protein
MMLTPHVNKNQLIQYARYTTLVGLIAMLMGCSHYPNKPFSLMDDKQPIKVTSVAVIAGSPGDGPKQLAQFVTDGLAEKSRFKVLSQEEIGDRVPNYPYAIKIKDDETLDKETDLETQVWFVPSEQAKLDALQKKLKVDYLYVLWIPWMRASTYQGKTTYLVWPSGNMIEYPGGRVVASTKISRSESDSPLALFRANDYYIVKVLEESAEDIVDELIVATNSAKAK